MIQVVQPIDGRPTEVAEVPEPACRPRQVLIANARSLISAGTERGLVALARKSLLAKARARPDHVRKVLEKVRREGLASTLGQVRAKLDRPMPLGYSSAGVVIEVGAGVESFRPGDRVASNGPHAGVVAVGVNLVAHVPDAVPMDRACYAVVGSIALQGVRLSRAGLGEVVAVVGLGLIGQLTVALLKAAGCVVVGTDLDPSKCELAQTSFGADWAGPRGFGEAVRTRSGGHGADAVLITASSRGNGPIELAAKVARAKGRVVAVGAVGMEIPRRESYPKELEFAVSCSYGPGRYDPAHEEAGVDYPYPYVRWTEGRNIQAVLDLMGSGRLDVAPLTTHTLDAADAASAYALIRGKGSTAVGVVLSYPELRAPARRVGLPRPSVAPIAGKLGVGFVGAGSFAGAVLIPALAKRPDVDLRAIASGGGLSARSQARASGFAAAVGGVDELVADPTVNAVFVATRHDQHADLLIRALESGKHVFVEKPLAIDAEQLGRIEAYLAASTGPLPIWTVGFNRRFSAAAGLVRDHFRGVDEPLTAGVRFNAGPLPSGHWTQDEAVGGGRLVGEACHAADLLTYLVGSPIARVHAESVSPRGRVETATDRAIITFKHANGSISTVHYAGGGDPAYPKERVEVFGGGRVGVVEDFRRVELSAGGRRVARKVAGKGHAEEVAAFVRAAIAGGPPPIPYAELLATTAAMLGAMESIRTGRAVDLIGGAA